VLSAPLAGSLRLGGGLGSSIPQAAAEEVVLGRPVAHNPQTEPASHGAARGLVADGVAEPQGWGAGDGLLGGPTASGIDGVVMGTPARGSGERPASSALSTVQERVRFDPKVGGNGMCHEVTTVNPEGTVERVV